MNDIINKTLDWLKEIAPHLLGSGILLLIGWWLTSFLTNMIKNGMIRAKIDASIISFTSSIIKTTLRIIVVISVLAQLGLNVASLVTAIGAAGVTAGLALKDSLSNFASGVLIILNKVFHMGDYLEFDGISGTVTNIDMMFTTLTTVDNKNIIIPNSKLTTDKIINYTAQETRRLDLNYLIGYDEDIAKVKSIISDIIMNSNKVLDEPKPIIGVGEHQDSGINIAVKIWCNVDDYWDLYYEMQEKVKTVFDEHQISIPFNQLDIHIKNK